MERLGIGSREELDQSEHFHADLVLTVFANIKPNALYMLVAKSRHNSTASKNAK